jgi:hypothetical protein
VPSVTGTGPSFGAAVRHAFEQASLGKPRPSFNRVSPRAQFRQLQRSAAGRRALAAAGVSVTGRTERSWLTGGRQPAARNRAAIARAYAAMRVGGMPPWVRTGTMSITGRVAYGPDIRNRGEGGSSPLLIDLKVGNETRHIVPGGDTHWQEIEEHWRELTDEELEDLIADELIAEDIGDGYPWGFGGPSYTVTISG